MTLNNACVLIRLVESDYRVDNSLLRAETGGLHYRRSRDVHDVDDAETSVVAWGGRVRGVDLGDGWLRLPNGFFLPMALDGKPVVILTMPSGELDWAEERFRLPASPEPQLIPAPRFGLAR